MRLLLASDALLAVLACTGTAFADDGAPAATPRFARAAAELGAEAGAGFGDACYRDSDYVGCASGMAFAGGRAALHYRPFQFVSFGLGASLARGSAAPHDDGTYFLLEPEARFHPSGAKAIDPSIALGAGWFVMGSSTGTKMAPELSLRFAIDFPLSRSFMLGPELRGFLILFGENPEFPPDKQASYATQRGIALALRATLRFAEEPP